MRNYVSVVLGIWTQICHSKNSWFLYITVWNLSRKWVICQNEMLTYRSVPSRSSRECLIEIGMLFTCLCWLEYSHFSCSCVLNNGCCSLGFGEVQLSVRLCRWVGGWWVCLTPNLSFQIPGMTFCYNYFFNICLLHYSYSFWWNIKMNALYPAYSDL